MKDRPIFNVNLIEKDKTIVYVVLPRLQDMTFEILALTVEFLNKYSKIIYLSHEFDYTFYRMIFSFSKTFSQVKNIEMAIYNSFIIRDIQANSAIVLYLSNDDYIIESNKKAIFCGINEKSDFVFNDLSQDSMFSIPVYLRSLLNFIGITEKRIISNIEVEYDDILEASNIVKNHKNEDFHVIFQNSMISSFKITNYLKKYRLTEKLLIISNKKLNISDPLAVFYKNYDFVDLLALHIYSKNIACDHAYDFEHITNNLRIGHIYTSSHKKEYSMLLKEISKLIIN